MTASNFTAQIDPFTTREAWLKAAESIMSEWIMIEGYDYPANTRVACGFPKTSKGRGRAIGQCWTKTVSDDLTFEIFICPSLADPVDVCGVLIHEMCHATVGIENGHNKVFGKLARALGMEGKLTSTTVGDDLRELIETRVLPSCGKYPHATLRAGDKSVGEPKKAKTYLKKAECDECGYTVRVTDRWLDMGAPLCPCNHEPMSIGA